MILLREIFSSNFGHTSGGLERIRRPRFEIATTNDNLKDFRTTAVTGDCSNMLNKKRRKCVLQIVLTITVIYSMLWITRTSSWIDNAEEMSFVDVNILRCKAQNLGCFVAIEHPAAKYTKINITEINEAEPFKESCLDACYKSGKHLAGYNMQSRTCVCSKTFKGFLSHKRDISPAFSWDLSQNCNHSKSLRIYSTIRSCERGVSEQTREEDRVGCIEIPKSLNGTMLALKNSQITAQQCILNCELRGFTFAIPVLKKNFCLCSDSYSLFGNAENMTKTIEVCDDKRGKSLVSVYRTVIDDDNCAPIKFLNPGQAPPILLVSFPGSGNTWIRHLIEVSTGIYTGSVYNDGHLYEGGMLGELIDFDNGRTIAVKDHSPKRRIKPGFRMTILLLRNPYDATLSEWSRRMTKNHTGVVGPQVFRSLGFKKYAEHRADNWIGLAKMVLTKVSKVLVVHYEDLKQDAVKEMHRIAEFLPRDLVPIGDKLEGRIMCMNLDLVGKFKRPPKKLDFDPFDADIRNRFDQKIKDLNDLLIEFNQPPLPDSYFPPS